MSCRSQAPSAPTASNAAKQAKARLFDPNKGIG